MEELSRRVLGALVVAAAGPGAAMLVLLLVAPTLVVATAPESGGGLVETTGSLLVGLLIGGLLSLVLAYVVAAAATLVALRMTGCPRPQLAWLVCVVLSPVWLGVLSGFGLGLVGFVVLAGVPLGMVRLGFGRLHRDVDLRVLHRDLVSTDDEPTSGSPV